MATVTKDGRVTTAPGSYEDVREKGLGWMLFGATVLGIAGVFGIIDGIVALSKSKFYTANAVYVFSDLRTWGWIVLVLGALAVTASLAVMSGSQWARWYGIVMAGLGAIAQLLFVQGYPFWSLCLFSLYVLTIYALAVYGGREYGR